MNDKLFIIRENPKFIISFLKETLEITKDNNPLNNKSYEYANIKSVSLKKEQNIFSYLIGSIISFLVAFDGTKNNKTVLLIETKNAKDEIYLENCDMVKIKKFIDKIETRISEVKE